MRMSALISESRGGDDALQVPASKWSLTWGQVYTYLVVLKISHQEKNQGPHPRSRNRKLGIGV